MLVPLTVAGQETRLRLLAPRATASELKLKVPYAKALARVSEGATLQSPGGDDQDTELTRCRPQRRFRTELAPARRCARQGRGIGGLWHDFAAHLDGRGVETDATFSVHSYGESFDRFRIRLPPDTELVPGNSSGYTLTAVDACGRRLPLRDGSDWLKSN